MALAIGSLSTSALHAQSNTASADLIVSLDIVDGCLINGSPDSVSELNFGTVQNAQGESQNVDASTDLTITCNVNSAAASLILDGGNNNTTGVRQLAPLLSGQNRNFIQYHLYGDPGRTDEYLVDQKLEIFTLTAGQPKVLTIYGRIEAAQLTGGSTPAGIYSDRVHAELSF